MYYATECGCPLESVEFIVLKALLWTNTHYLMAIFQINLYELVVPPPTFSTSIPTLCMLLVQAYTFHIRNIFLPEAWTSYVLPVLLQQSHATFAAVSIIKSKHPSLPFLMTKLTCFPIPTIL